MKFNPPFEIHIVTDGNILTFVNFIKDKAIYRYTKSNQKLGQQLELTEAELNKLINLQSQLKIKK